MPSLVLDAPTLRVASYVMFSGTVLYAAKVLVAALRGRSGTAATTGVLGWSAQMDEIEGYPPGHGERVAALAVAMAERYGLGQATADALHMAGLLHDVGELEMGFIAQPGALTAEETTLLWSHPIIGARMVAEAGYEAAGAIIRHHHERWDGTGYPDRLRGEAIPLPARILAVADVYEAFCHDRPYRPGVGADGALAELKRRAGTLLDPQVVQVFCTLQDGLAGDSPGGEF
ncbi:MAG: HD domain-containing protein [Candidatus Sericytochromatia bacterium]|nr:HD domain-containing protein [Candidatus Sericytochromatia bacterium]